MKDKPIISPEKEYDALRQELLKRLEFQNTFLSIVLTVIGAFFGFGLSNKNNTLILFIPILVLLFAVLWKNNAYYRTQIRFYIEHVFEHDKSLLNWETFISPDVDNFSIKHSFLTLGVGGIFTGLPTFAVLIGLIGYKGTLVENGLIIIDILAILLIVYIFFRYTTQRIRNQLKKEVVFNRED